MVIQLREGVSERCRAPWAVTGIQAGDEHPMTGREMRPAVDVQLGVPGDDPRPGFISWEMSPQDALAMAGHLIEMAAHAARPPQYQCPRCERTSHHPADSREGYCGNCHDYTRDG